MTDSQIKNDEIHIENLEIYANHGVFPEEAKLGQKFYVSITVYMNTMKAGKSDDLLLSVDYGEICKFATSFLRKNRFKLIETAAEKLAEEILFKYKIIKGVEIELKKPWAPIGLPLEYVSVKIKRFWHYAYISLGSNMGNKKSYLDWAVKMLSKRKDTTVLKVSEYMVTKPYGVIDQDEFLNACLLLKTQLLPHDLLSELHTIENDAGRKRTVRWGPRTLDLDIIFYDDITIETDDLVIPHIDMKNREFVLKPLSEIAPNKRHPLYKKTVTEMLNELYMK